MKGKSNGSRKMAPLLSAGPSFFPQTHTHQSAKLKCILTTFSQKVKTTQLLHRPNKQTKTQTNTLSDRTHFGWYADSGRLTDKTPKWALSSTNVGQAFALGAQMLKMYKRLKWGNVCVALERFHHHHHHCVCLCVCVCDFNTNQENAKQRKRCPEPTKSTRRGRKLNSDSCTYPNQNAEDQKRREGHQQQQQQQQQFFQGLPK